MRTRNTVLLSSAFALAAAINAVAAHAQSTAAYDAPRPQLAVNYNYAHSNAPVGGCGCFGLNGGSAAFAYPLRRAGLSLVADASVTHANAISTNSQDLTLSTFTAGARIALPQWHTPLHPFGELLAGLAHANGSLISTPGSAASNSGAAFASLLGGGIDLRATHRLSIRLIEADYLLTTFDNGSNNHQNNRRLAAGVILHF